MVRGSIDSGETDHDVGKHIQKEADGRQEAEKERQEEARNKKILLQICSQRTILWGSGLCQELVRLSGFRDPGTPAPT